MEQTPILGFVPSQLVRWIADKPAGASESPSKRREMAVLFADLTDFSTTTLEITAKERAGPEKVSELLDSIFSPVIEGIKLHGGEILGFAGDSVLATWTVDEEMSGRQAASLAAACGLHIQSLVPAASGADRTPRLRIGIGFGAAVMLRVGGFDDRWHFAIGGAPFAQIGNSIDAAESGDVVLSAEAHRLVPSAEGDLLETDQFRVHRIQGVATPGGEPLPDVDESATEDLRSFVASPLVDRLEAGQAEWLGEFRRVTSVFINLPSLDISSESDRASLNSVVIAAQRELGRYNGTLQDILIDDKGVTIMCAFGLPRRTHEDDPDRAVEAALAIREKLLSMRLDFAVGIATGRAYCGAVGSLGLRRYTTIGPSVNLAARLMQQEMFDVVCDLETFRAAHRTKLHPRPPQLVRGWDAPVETFKAVWDKEPLARRTGARHLIGRDEERELLLDEMRALDGPAPAQLVLLTGEAGIGKTALAEDLISHVTDMGVQTLYGRALPVGMDPYHAWRDIIEEVLDLSGVRAIETRQKMTLEKLSDLTEFAEVHSLLNPLLDLGFPETEAVRGMSGANRGETTVELLLTLLNKAAAEEPVLIVIDDAQWFDLASLALTEAAARHLRSVLMLVLARPESETPEILPKLENVATSHIRLAAIDDEDALDLAKQVLEAQDLEAGLANMVVGRAEGVPFFVEELVLSLRDADQLTVTEGTAQLTVPEVELTVPDSLRSVVFSRIDQLGEAPQLTVKVASVIGRSFGMDQLAAVHPTATAHGTLEEDLEDLIARGLITESDATPGVYDFRHALIRETAYETFAFENRREIHAEVAKSVESTTEGGAEPPYSLLAYHWRRAEDPPQALKYSELAGASAFRKGAIRDAISEHSESLKLLEEHTEQLSDVSRLRRSSWYVEIGQAHEAIGEHAKAEERFYEALALADVHLPQTTLGRVGRLVWETAKQLLHIVLPAAIRVPDEEEEQTRLGHAARVAALIGEIYYFTEDVLGYILLNMVSINLGEKVDQRQMAGLAYSSLGYLVGTMRLRGLARRYFRWARLSEQSEFDRTFAQPQYVLDLIDMGPGHLISVAQAESVLALTFNNLAEAERIVDEGLERSVRYGDRFSASISHAIRGFGRYCAGDLQGALSDYKSLLHSAVDRANPEHEGWARALAIPIMLARNDLEAALSAGTRATEMIDRVGQTNVPIVHGVHAQVELAHGNRDGALESARQALATFGSTPVFIQLAGFHGMMDTLLRLLESGESDPQQQAELTRLAKRGLRKMRIFALILPFARPKHLLMRGRLQFLQGRTAAAQRSFRKGLALAQGNGFRWDEGLLRLSLATSLQVEKPERASLVAAATQILEDVGSQSDIDRADSING